MRNTFCSPSASIPKYDPRKNHTLNTETPYKIAPKYSIESLNDESSFNLNVSTSTEIDAPSFNLPTIKKYEYIILLKKKFNVFFLQETSK